MDFYNDKHKYLFSKIINERDIIMLIHGGHGFKVLKNVEMLEIKQGPYSLIKDKIISQIKFEIKTFTEDKLPKELKKIEPTKPGSRNLSK